ncbi:putative basic amino acid antiporter YfcC [Fusobacterium mortiferum]|uniref:putative basic amino acid antiporter YfcC n=1 Tax=Fusobacterium mortiferum TaxID=850 RepID=UPI000E53818D|nr:putative basic amino acid antiporter YfcC [Fusobacterium mortiferum]RHF69158.1 putative basic amino acid antiporter YfcC [Fusobacterium mortiferum]
MKKKFNMPDTYVIIFFVVIFAAILTHTVPVGKFQMEKVTYVTETGAEKSREVPVAGSFTYELDEQGEPLVKGVKFFEPGGEVGVSNYVFEGITSGDKWGTAVGVIAFIIITGGAFGIILRTKAVEAGLFTLIRKTKGSEYLLLPIVFFFFSLGGAVFGMGEEAIPFAMVLIPIVIGMGYDAVTGILITYVSTQIGFATSWMNPFSVAIAQGVAGVPVLSGASFRIFMWVFFTALEIVFTLRYAKKVKENPQSSISYETDAFYRNEFNMEEQQDIEFKLGHKLVLLIVALGMAWVIYGVVKFGYFLPEIATQFVIMGVASGIVGVIFKLGDMRINDIASSFRKGAEDLIGAAIVVGMAKGIVLVLGGADAGTPSVLNTVLNWVANGLSGLPSAICAWVMYIFQSVFNFFVVSGSGQAALTMPIMAPLSDLVGVPRQVAVLAFQLGDGFTNLIVPTSGILIAILGIAKLDWLVWAKFQIKFQGILFFFGSIFVIVGVLMNLQ